MFGWVLFCCCCWGFGVGFFWGVVVVVGFFFCIIIFFCNNTLDADKNVDFEKGTEYFDIYLSAALSVLRV